MEIDFDEKELYYMKCNQAFADVFGLTPKEIAGKRARKDLGVTLL
jgi:PAS domain-containing protein